MGHVKANPQVDERGQETGIIGLEITYGGKEAPFGGIDSSAPPAYIDPNCAVEQNGILVVDNQLVCTAMQPFTLPVLWNGATGADQIQLLGAGSFYSSVFGTLNYVFGGAVSPFGVPGVGPTGALYNYFMTSWNPATPGSPNTDVLSVSLYDTGKPAQPASLSLDCVQAQTLVSTAGSGAGLIVDSTSSGAIVTYTLIHSGAGFLVGEAVLFQGEAGTGAWILVTGIGGGGVITSSTLLTGGTGYNSGDFAWSQFVGGATLTEVQVSGPSGTFSQQTTSYGNASTKIQIVAALVAAFAGVTPDVTVSASKDGLSLIFTANVAGTAGNAITVQDLSTNSNALLPPTFYFSTGGPRNLIGGEAILPTPAPRSFDGMANTTSVGSILYLANLGPMILKYSGPGGFDTSSLYQGVKCLRKFSGSLIGLGLIPSLGTVLQGSDMIFTWTSALNLDEWAPIDSTGNITGAGFSQLADVGDFLTGLVVTNNTAFILRSQGLSYASALASGTNPYQFSHVALGERGEGAQLPQLITQYNESGIFVGNTDIYKVAGSLESIGAKIRAAFFNSLNTNSGELLAAGSCSVFIGGVTFPIVSFGIDGELYFFVAEDNTWASCMFSDAGTATKTFATFALEPSISGDGNFSQTALVLVTQAAGSYSVQANQLVDGVPEPGDSTTSYIIFPQEEVAFGRDVTIDAIYFSYLSDANQPVTVTFFISGVQYASVTVNTNTLHTPVEQKVFFGSPGIFTAHSPQLKAVITTGSSGSSPYFYITKLQMYGSFDPAQRPV